MSKGHPSFKYTAHCTFRYVKNPTHYSKMKCMPTDKASKKLIFLAQFPLKILTKFAAILPQHMQEWLKTPKHGNKAFFLQSTEVFKPASFDTVPIKDLVFFVSFHLSNHTPAYLSLFLNLQFHLSVHSFLVEDFHSFFPSN